MPSRGRAKRCAGGGETAIESPPRRGPGDSLGTGRLPGSPGRKQQSPEQPPAEPAAPDLPSSRLRAPQPEHKDPLQRAVPFTLGMHQESAVTCHPAPRGARAEPPGAGARQRCLTRARRCERGGDAERGRRSPKRRTAAAGRRGTGERRAVLCSAQSPSKAGVVSK